MVLRLSVVAVLFAALLTPPAAKAGLLGVAGEYNVFTLGDFTQQNTDSEGRVAVGGKFDPGGTIGKPLNGSAGYTVAMAKPASTSATPNLVVGGDFRMNSYSVNGDALIAGNATFNTPTVTGNLTTGGDLTVRWGGSVGGNVGYAGTLNDELHYKFYGGTLSHLASAPSLPFSFAAEGAYLQQLSTTLAGLAPTGTVAFNGNVGSGTKGQFTLTGTNATQDIFNISGAELALANSLTINAKPGETVVLNIDGTADQMANFGIFLNGIDKQHVLYNFSNATSLTFNSIGILGTVLAPFADINFIGGNIDGTMIGKSLQGQGQSNDYLFNGNVNLPTAPVPEPSTFATASIGLLALGYFARRNRKKC